MVSSRVSTSAAEPAAGSGVVVRTLPFAGDDASMVAAMRAGNRAAIAAFYVRYEAHVLRTLMRVLGPERELPDLLHDVLVGALASLDELRDPRALKPWITSIAVFTARTRILRRSRRSWLRFLPWHELPDVEAPTPSGEVTEALRATYAVLNELPVDERIPFALRFIGGMELVEVADACGVSLATIKRRLARAESRFTALAREHPALSDWIEGGARWGTPKKR
ncbi:RNA polymerase sigma factor [Sorangium sp. So ce426]|uniref:RNA polymerase sigma factor n=1 Tax=Sorangium sp. So ce426 TaxID=3133312 RepID=UPI003F5B071D